MIERKNTYIASFGALCASWIGGWDGDMWTLCVFMLIDYITGLIVAGVFKKSSKTENGALESNAGLKGLCRKGAMLLLVLIAARLDLLMDLSGVLRTGVIIALVCNEAISILENVGLMGVQYPKIIKDAIDKLQGGKNARMNLTLHSCVFYVYAVFKLNYFASIASIFCVYRVRVQEAKKEMIT